MTVPVDTAVTAAAAALLVALAEELRARRRAQQARAERQLERDRIAAELARHRGELVDTLKTAPAIDTDALRER